MMLKMYVFMSFNQCTLHSLIKCVFSTDTYLLLIFYASPFGIFVTHACDKFRQLSNIVIEGIATKSLLSNLVHQRRRHSNNFMLYTPVSASQDIYVDVRRQEGSTSSRPYVYRWANIRVP